MTPGPELAQRDRALQSNRYRRSPRWLVWLTVAGYRPRDDPQHRPIRLTLPAQQVEGNRRADADRKARGLRSRLRDALRGE